MAGKEVVVEEGVIQCEHGGKVVLKSSVANHTIGGRKPLYDIDILQAQIQGCTYNSAVNGQCTQVAAISSAVTETNVANGGKNYLLRVDGCVSDKGATLVLLDPGQTNTHVPVKSQGSAGSITVEELEDTKLDTKENLKREKYRIYPLRKSSSHIRALRGAREFDVRTDTYATQEGSEHRAEKIITRTDAYLYVTLGKETREYKVINQGDTFRPRLNRVVFKDTQTEVIRRYIPVYETGGDVKLLYSNIRLDKKQREMFAVTTLSLGEKKASYIKDYRVLAKSHVLSEKEFKNRLTPLKKLQQAQPRYYNTVVLIDDPIGEVEDLYNEYEFSYHRHYAMNKELIEDIRGKNQYVYSVVNLLDYLYIDNTEKNRHKSRKSDLQKLYNKLVDLVSLQMGSAVEEYMAGKNIAPAIDYKVANDYYSELTFLFKDFFEHSRTFSLKLSDGYHYSLSKRPGRWQCFTSSTKHPELNNDIQKSIAFLVFSVSFSSRYEAQRTAELNNIAEEFYFLVKTSKPLPPFSETILKDVKEELDYQGAYRNLFHRYTTSFLTQYEFLKTQHKQIAFDPKYYAKKKAPFRLKKLQVGKNPKEVHYDKDLQTPKSIATDIAKCLGSKELQSHLDKLINIDYFESEESKLEYFDTLLNISYTLIAPRAKLDEESEVLSLFNKKFNTTLTPFIQKLIEKRHTLSQESAIALYNKPIQPYFTEALFTVLAHALTEGKTAKTRKSNAQTFLRHFNQEIPAPQTDTEKILDHNFDKELTFKSDVEHLFATLKKIDGITSYIDKFDETVSNSTTSGRASDSNTKLSKYKDIKSSKLYKTSLNAAKTLSFAVVFINFYDIASGKEKMTLKNTVGMASDVINATKQLHEWFPNRETLQKLKSNLPRSVEFALQLDRAFSSSTVRVLSRFGVVGAMLGAYDEISEIDEDTNGQYRTAVEIKNALYLILLFTPAFIALGGVALTELIWYFLNNSIKNSAIELYLYDSLLFNKDDHNNWRTFNHIDAPKAFTAKIFLDTLHSKNLHREIEGFNTIKELQTFLCDTYEKHPSLIYNAMKNEHNRLLSVLYDVNLSIDEDHMIPISNPFYTHNNTTYFAYPYVKLSKGLAEEMTHLVQLHNKMVLKEVQPLLHEDGETYYSTLFKVNVDTMQALGHMDATELIIATKHIALKYKVTYEYETPSLGQGRPNRPMDILKITKLQSIPMSADDYKLVQHNTGDKQQ